MQCKSKSPNLQAAASPLIKLGASSGGHFVGGASFHVDVIAHLRNGTKGRLGEMNSRWGEELITRTEAGFRYSRICRERVVVAVKTATQQLFINCARTKNVTQF